MMRIFRGCVLLALLSVLMSNNAATAIEQPPTLAPASQPAEPTEALKATCIRLKGTVQYAPISAKSTDADVWKAVEIGHEYGQGVQIRTGIRSSALFKFGDDTVVLVDRSTLAAISEFHKTASVKKTRIGLDYGAVRAGVAEGGLRSDFAIDSPVATLSKRGTWDFAMWVERGTGRFDVRLSDRGLVEILNKHTGQTAQIRPNQFVTQAMMFWADTAKFDRQVVLTDVFSQTLEEMTVYARSNTGRTGLDPAGNPVEEGAAGARTTQIQTADLSGTISRELLAQAISGRRPQPTPPQPIVVTAREGDFGVGTSIEAVQGETTNTAKKILRRMVLRPIRQMPTAKRSSPSR